MRLNEGKLEEEAAKPKSFVRNMVISGMDDEKKVIGDSTSLSQNCDSTFADHRLCWRLERNEIVEADEPLRERYRRRAPAGAASAAGSRFRFSFLGSFLKSFCVERRGSTSSSCECCSFECNV